MESNLSAPKRRGRPVGSKNKKNKEVVPNPSESMEGDGMGLHLKILEVAAGCDVIAAVNDYANRRQVAVSVISTHGNVRNLIVYQLNRTPLISSAYKLLSLKGSFYGSSSSVRPLLPFCTRYIISVISREGNYYAGFVRGKLTASSNVFLGVSVISGTDSIKLPLPLPFPRSLSFPQLFVDLDEGLPESSSGAGRSRAAYGVPAAPSPPPLTPSTSFMTYEFVKQRLAEHACANN